MIPEQHELDGLEVFFQILLIGELFTPSRLEGQKKHLAEILRKCGLTLLSSDFMILDRSRIGNSTVTIAKYALDYVQDSDTSGRRIFVEGTITSQTDELGNTHIRISSKTDPFRLKFETTQSEESLISENI